MIFTLKILKIKSVNTVLSPSEQIWEVSMQRKTEDPPEIQYRRCRALTFKTNGARKTTFSSYPLKTDANLLTERSVRSEGSAAELTWESMFLWTMLGGNSSSNSQWEVWFYKRQGVWRAAKKKRTVNVFTAVQFFSAELVGNYNQVSEI